MSVNPDYDEDDEDSQEYDLYYALKNSNKHVVWADLEDIPQYVQDVNSQNCCKYRTGDNEYQEYRQQSCA